jgi:Flp pilus assembly protein TadB
MSRIAIKSKVKRKKVREPYDAELNDLREWQENVYNPGHYVGTGKLSYPLKNLARSAKQNLARHPKLKRAYLLHIILLIVIMLFFMDLVWYQVIAAILVIATVILIIWDGNRIIKNK